jgi:hypothetical protein
VRNFGEGGRHFCNIDKLIAAVDKELGPETTVLVKGSRFMKMERVADALAAPVEEKTDAACTRPMARPGRAFLQRLQLHHAAHGAGGDDGAAAFLAAGPSVIRWLAAKKIGQAVRNDGPIPTSPRPARRPWAAC